MHCLLALVYEARGLSGRRLYGFRQAIDRSEVISWRLYSVNEHNSVKKKYFRTKFVYKDT